MKLSTIVGAIAILSGIGTVSAQTPKAYFQQETNFRISVALDDKLHRLRGEETLEYINNSPDELSFIYIHLWANAYKNTQTAWAKQMELNGSLAFRDSEPQAKGWIDSLAWKTADGQALRMEIDPKYIDIAKVFLPSPLKPKQKITLSTPFVVQIPADFSRMGHSGQAYQVTQWYPKPAVYDPLGWHPMPYLDQGEFYSEFGKFDVSITVPQNYRVASTGVLQNADEQRWIDSIATATAENKTTILAQSQKKEPFPASSTSTKTLRYTQDAIHDFGWFADKRFNILKSQVALPKSGKNIDTYVFFPNEKYAPLWFDAVAYVDSAVYYYSKWIGEYPYPAATAVRGALRAGGGMEYPMITVISSDANAFSLDNVITHEVGHNWLYGILGSNERDFVWMDESVNTFFQDRIMVKKYPKASLADGIGMEGPLASQLKDVPYRRMSELAGLLTTRDNKHQAITTQSEDFTEMNYGMLAYMKGAFLMDYLLNYLGEARFDAAMHLYYDRWAFKHPHPEDMQRVFEESTGEKLDWLFVDLLGSRDQIDYGISSVKPAANDMLDVKITQNDKIAAPFLLVGLNDGEVIAQRWYPGFAEGAKVVQFPAGDYEELIIDPEHITPELNRDNDIYRFHAAFKTVEKFRVKKFTGLENERWNNLYVLPVIGFNNRDKFLVGAAFHNVGILSRKFNFYVAPMYSVGDKTLAGAAFVKYDLLPRKAFQKIRFELNAQRYAGWQRISPNVTFTFMPHDMLRSPQQTLQFAFHDIRISDKQADSYLFRYPQQYQLITARYALSSSGKLHSQSLKIHATAKANTQSFGLLEGEYTTQLRYKKGKYFYARLYAGGFLWSESAQPTAFALQASGGTDYTMEQYLYNRTQGANGTATQRIATQGGMIGYTGYATQSQLYTVLISADNPSIPLLRVYGEYGFMPSRVGYNAQNLYGAGISLHLLKDYLAVYMPLVGSNYWLQNQGKSYRPTSASNLFENIRISLNLSGLKPYELANKLF